MPSPSKLVLCVIDAMDSEMLLRTVREGGAPTLGGLIERGALITDCVSAFPSVTPVCAASIVTGARQDRHAIPGMNWYHREESRYIEYGSSLRSSQRFGIARQLTDLVYNMNGAHLAPEPTTIFERLDDAGVRTAGTTYLMYRGRHRHEPQRDTALGKLAANTLMRHPVLGPKELFYAEIFASRRTPCHTVLGMPGIRDRHSGCVGAHLVEHDLFDFMLFSLPDNDWVSHRQGLEGQVASIAQADLQLARMMAPAGGLEGFLEDHAVIVMADHSHAPIASATSIHQDLSDLQVLAPMGSSSTTGGSSPQLAVCPSQRAAGIYVLHPEAHDTLVPMVVRECLRLEGVGLAAWLEQGSGPPVEAAVRGPSSGLGTAGLGGAGRAGAGRAGAGRAGAGRAGARRAGAGWGAAGLGRSGELRFAPGGDLTDLRGESWSVEGDLSVLGATIQDGVILTPEHPDALARLHAALTCPTSGEVLLSAAPGFEFADWGGRAHIGGGSHGSLRAEDSLCPLILCGVDPPRGMQAPPPLVVASSGSESVIADAVAPASHGSPGSHPFAIQDVTPMIEGFFGL